MIAVCRRLALLVLPVVLLLGGPCLAADGDWAEPKFDPPVGSKWIVARQLDVEKNTGGTIVGHTLKETALLSIEEKTETGYVMTFTRQISSYEGDPAGAAAQRIAFQALQGLQVRFDTDAAGKPLRIENWDAVKAALKGASESEPVNTADPDKLAKIHDYTARMVAVDDKKAAELFLEELPNLAMGQNTGLKPGELHKSTMPVANAATDGITKTVVMSIADNDQAAGKVRYLMTQTYDPDSVKALISQTIRELNVTNVNAGLVDQALKNSAVTAVIRAELVVEGGMTRQMRGECLTSLRVPGSLAVEREDELVTVTPTEEKVSMKSGQ
jgi:hypothetical protein